MNYRKMNKKQFQLELEKELHHTKARLLELAQGLAAAKDGAKTRFETVHEELTARRDALVEKLEEFRGSAGNAWPELRNGMAHAWEELRDGIESAEEELLGARSTS